MIDIHKVVNAVETEADVVVVCASAHGGTVHILPYWECDKTADELQAIAIQECLRLADEHGNGEWTATVIDKRQSDN